MSANVRNAGAANLKARGLVPVTAGMTPEQRDRVRAAAALAGDGSIRAFAARVLAEAAERVLAATAGKKSEKK